MPDTQPFQPRTTAQDPREEEAASEESAADESTLTDAAPALPTGADEPVPTEPLPSDSDEPVEDEAAQPLQVDSPGDSGSRDDSEVVADGDDDEIADRPEHPPLDDLTDAGPEDDGVVGNRLWPDGAVDDLRRRWDAIQLRFVDDPAAVAMEAKSLVSEAIQQLKAALDDRSQELSEMSDEGDTEQLRLQVARYRTVFEGLVSHH